MSGVEKGRKLPFKVSKKLWPTDWLVLWQESLVISNWSVRYRARVKQVVGGFLAYTAYSSLLNEPSQNTIKSYAITLEDYLSGSSTVTYMEGLAYGLLALFPDEDWVWLQEFNRELRNKKIVKQARKPAKVKAKEALRLKFDQWGADEQTRWEKAFAARPSILSKRIPRRSERKQAKNTQATPKAEKFQKPPHLWSPLFCSRVERGWGMFRHWCAQNNKDPMMPESFSKFTGDCTERELSPVSVTSYAFGAYRAATIIYPELDWSWQRACCTELEDTAEPIKDKLQKYVPPDQLFSFAIDLMNDASNGIATTTTAIKFRDGLFLALLCLIPKRVGNLGTITIGENLLLNDEGIPEEFYFPTTKNGDDSTAPFPPELVAFYQEWMGRFRPVLLKSKDDTHAMWIGRDGKPLGTHAFWAQLTKRTKEKFGKAVGPHMVRSCFATFFAEKGPEFMPLVQRALDHRDQRSIQYYQLMAGSFAAARELALAQDKIRVPPPAQHKS